MSDPNVAEAAQPAAPVAPANNVPDHELVLEPDEQVNIRLPAVMDDVFSANHSLQDENSEVEVVSLMWRRGVHYVAKLT